MADDDLTDLEIDDEVITCWCGEVGTADELFDDACLDSGCGGTGVLYCHCGGDLCVCHFHGETECPGCSDCESNDNDFDDDQDWYDDHETSGEG